MTTEPIAAIDASGGLPEGLAERAMPVVLRGLVAHWPAAQAGAASDREAVDYLRRFDRGATVPAMVAPPEAAGRLTHNDALTGFTFHYEQRPLAQILDALLAMAGQAAVPTLYVGSSTIDSYLPGFNSENGLPIPDAAPLASIWIGNRSRIPTHQDLPDNIACVVAGRRRVTLFPPGQLRNLYIGPLDVTPAGQPVSLADPTAPDLARFPRFAEALAHAQVAELAPGDAVFIPSMWWHHMEGLGEINVLVNYWWRRTPGWMDTPMNALMLALMTLRDLPPEQRAIWQETFRHYVFEADADTAAHVPDHARRILAPFDDTLARDLRARLLQRLNR